MFISIFFASIQRWRHSHEATRILHSLSDSALKDIGLDRSSITYAVWHGRQPSILLIAGHRRSHNSANCALGVPSDVLAPTHPKSPLGPAAAGFSMSMRVTSAATVVVRDVRDWFSVPQHDIRSSL